MPTRAPPARIAPTSSVRRAVSTAASRTGEHLLLPHAVDVLAHLQRGAERDVEVAVLAEREQRPRPGDGLPHAGRLVEVGVAQPRDGGDDAAGDLLGHA